MQILIRALLPFAVHRILKGNLAPGGAVAKITGKEGLEFTGKARTFDTEDAFVEAVENGEIKKGEKTVAVLRYLGPKGGPGEPFSQDSLFFCWEPTNVPLRFLPFFLFLSLVCCFEAILVRRMIRPPQLRRLIFPICTIP